MAISRKIYPAILALLICITISCNTTESNHDNRFEDGILIEVRELLGENVLDVIENELDFPIHRGTNPPNILEEITGSSGDAVAVIFDPTVLVKSNVADENQSPGLEFADTFIRFSNQDLDNFRIKFDRTHLGYEPFLGDNSFIIGEGKNFTVFGLEYEEYEAGTVLTVNIFSGGVEADGISSAFGGIVMIENHGINGYIENGTGRIFRDGDGFADLDEWPSTGGINTAAFETDVLSTNVWTE